MTGVSFFDGTASHVATFDAGTGTWTFGWATVPVGTYSVVAVATDNGGLSATSAAVSVEIDSLIAPTVAITSPASGMIAGQGWKIVLTASTTNGTPGSVSGVAFFDGTAKLGDAVLAGAAWTYLWNTTSAACGSHSLTAKATDSGSLSATSTPVLVTMCIPGDGNNDGLVDGKDYGVWQNGYGHTAGFATGDYNGDGAVDGKDYGIWQNNYGHTSATGDAVAAASPGDADVTTVMAATAASAASSDAAALPVSSGGAPRLIAMTPASGTVASSVTRVGLVFDSNVQIAAGAVEVRGFTTGTHGDFTVAYNAATRTLTLTWAQPLPADVYALRVVADFVVGVDNGAPLGGETGNPAAATLPSGNGAPGGDARIEFTAE